ncbi:hypothetical protein K1719_029429 [Acacia pycnantha]|nr:hypothetical protein K1719_029429 [Acacia pycnantha]
MSITSCLNPQICSSLPPQVRFGKQLKSATLLPRATHLQVSEDAPIEESEPSSPKAIGQHDVLIVSPGVLGHLVAEKWRENRECLDVKHEDMTMSYDLP